MKRAESHQEAKRPLQGEAENCQAMNVETLIIPNEMHQFDLLFMLSDTLYRNKYKYMLSRIDVA